jgi:hypothetical protein
VIDATKSMRQVWEALMRSSSTSAPGPAPQWAGLEWPATARVIWDALRDFDTPLSDALVRMSTMPRSWRSSSPSHHISSLLTPGICCS